METRTAAGLRFGPLGAECVNLCVDMQNLFAGRTDWHTPWLRRVLPTDAVCSSTDRTHDALLVLHHERYGQPIEAATTQEILESWI